MAVNSILDLASNPIYLKILQNEATKRGCYVAPSEIFNILDRVAPPLVKSAPKPEQPLAIFMCGPAGSGKTTIRGPLLEDLGIDDDNIIKADPDEIIQSFEQWKGPGRMQCHSASSYILYDILMPIFAASGYHVVFDTTCRDVGFAEKFMRLLKKHGYYIIMSSVYVSKKTALKRTEERGRISGRVVPRQFVELIYDQFMKAAKQYMKTKEIDEIRLFNNEGSSAIMIFHRKDGEVLLKEGGYKFYFSLKDF